MILSTPRWWTLILTTTAAGLLTVGMVGQNGRVLVVTNTRASGDGSLADALSKANLSSSGATITFAIPKSDPGFDAAAGVWRIKVGSPLPPLLVPGIVIDGGSQASAFGDTNPTGPEIVIEGSGMELDTGMVLLSARCTRTCASEGSSTA